MPSSLHVVQQNQKPAQLNAIIAIILYNLNILAV